MLLDNLSYQLGQRETRSKGILAVIVAFNESDLGRWETQLDYAQRDSNDHGSEIRDNRKGQLHNLTLWPLGLSSHPYQGMLFLEEDTSDKI